jgi:hypothetical protein
VDCVKHLPYLVACLLLLTAVAAAPSATALHCTSVGGNLGDQVAQTCNDVIAAVYGGNVVRDLLDAIDSFCMNQLGRTCIP